MPSFSVWRQRSAMMRGDRARLDLSTAGRPHVADVALAGLLRFWRSVTGNHPDVRACGCGIRAEFPRDKRRGAMTGVGNRRHHPAGRFSGLPLVGVAKEELGCFSPGQLELSGTAIVGAPVDFVVNRDLEEDFLQVKANASAPGFAALASRLSGLEIAAGLAAP